MWRSCGTAILRMFTVSALLAFPFGVARFVQFFHPRHLHIASGFEDNTPLLLPPTFSFLSAGTQSFVFVHNDLILKCFSSRNPKRLKRALDGAQIAWEHLREETGLLYLHLHQTTHLPTVTLQDRLGRPHSIDLNQIAFVLQRRALPLPHPTSEQLASYRAFVRNRVAKHIGNTDTAFPHNIALLDNRVIEIDFGEYWHHPLLEDPLEAEREYETFHQKLLRWEKRHP